MKEKIVGIFVCMLMIATAVPAVTSIKNNVINTMVPSHPQASMEGGWIETQKLLASDGQGGDTFGYTLDFEGDTAIIGSYQDDDNGLNSGSAYVFTRSGTTWTQQQKLLPSDGAYGDNFGWGVDLNGDTVIITAIRDDNENGNESGAAYVFIRSGTTWTQQAKLIASDGQEQDHFGYSLALLGDTALIGAYWDDDNGNDSGSMYVFTLSGTTWTQQAKVLAPDGAAGDIFGSWICFAGDTALIGAGMDDDNGVDSGSIYEFTRSGTTWTEQQKLHASDGAAGDQFGSNFDLYGDTLLVGSMLDDDMGKDSGSAYIFTRTGTTWTQQQKLLPSDGYTNDQFGVVSLDGDTALIGAWYDDDMGSNSGSVYVFTKSALTFTITGGLGVKAVITNNGTSDVTGVAWQIHTDGGILGLINKTVNGTVDIKVGESKTVSTGMLLGLGSISIHARVAGVEKTATGTVFLFFILGVKGG